jgi:hypothetical protein
MNYIEEIENPNRQGSLFTESYFINEDKTKIKLRVQITTEYTCANSNTIFNVYVSYKKYKCRNWSSDKLIDVENKCIEGLTDQEALQAMYTAQNNHWEMLNPLKAYTNGTYNGIDVGFKVAPLNMSGIKKLRSIR